MIRDEATKDERLHEVLGLYYEAAESGHEPDRAAWIADHPDLADDLASFFANQDRLSQLVRPVDPPIDDFGDYEILREIARGGMGIVFEARQKSLNRTVALKMILDGAYASPDALRRFRIEAESAASLDHPNIVPIHEVNDHAGRPYISMKYLPGGSLADHLGDYLSNPRAAAKLLTTIARAVHHAHQRGVLHRDLKPANILLDAEGQPHVADFGLARRAASSENSTITMPGVLIGSPPYMAPEQASGDVHKLSVATDVYGLGGILYALVTGRPPFKGDSPLQTLELVRARAPESPTSINPRINRDLETICLKCLEKDASRRYASAEALAEDLERWLNGEPIAARLAGRWERSWRWCRRNPIVAGLAGTLAASLIMGLIGLSAAVVTISAGRRQADDRLDLARQVVDDMYTKVAIDWIQQQESLQIVQREFLGKAADFYDSYARLRATNPRDWRETSEIYRRLGKIEDKLGRSAERSFRRSLDLTDRILTRFPDDLDARMRGAETYDDLGLHFHAMGATGRAGEAFRSCLDRCERLLDRAPENGDYRQLIGIATNNLSRSLFYQGRTEEAWKFHTRSLETLQRLCGDFPDSVPYRFTLAEARLWLGFLLLEKKGQAAQAESAYRQARDVLAKLVQESPGKSLFRIKLAWAENILGELTRKGRSLVASEDHYRKSLALREPLADQSPDVPGRRADLSSSLNGLGLTLRDQGRHHEAEQAFRRSIAESEKLAALFPDVPDYRSQLGGHLSNLSTLLMKQSRFSAAKPLLERAIESQHVALKASPRNPTYRNFCENITSISQIPCWKRRIMRVR